MLTRLRSQKSNWPTSLGAPAANLRRRHRPFVRGLARLALLLPVAGLVIGCSATGDIDNTAAAVFLRIDSMLFDDTENHVWGDVITGGILLGDSATFEFSAFLKAPITTDPSVVKPELQSIVLDRYEVTFRRTDGGTSIPPGFTRGIAGVVRLSEPAAEEIIITTVSGVVIVPSTTKGMPPISYLISPGSEPGTNFTNIQVNARVEFFGWTIAGDEVSVVANIGVNFADYGDPAEDPGND